MNSEFPCNPEGLTAYLDGELSAAEAVRVEAWLAESDEARALEGRLRGVREELRRFSATVRGPHGPKLPGEWTERLLARLAAPALDETSRPTVAPFSLDDLPLSNVPAPVSYWRTLAFRQTLCVGAAAAAVLLLLAAPALRIGSPNDVAMFPQSAARPTSAVEPLAEYSGEGQGRAESETVAGAADGVADAKAKQNLKHTGAADEAREDEGTAFYSIQNRVPKHRGNDAPKAGLGAAAGFAGPGDAAAVQGDAVTDAPQVETVRPNWARDGEPKGKGQGAEDKPVAGPSQFKANRNAANAPSNGAPDADRDGGSTGNNRGIAPEQATVEGQKVRDAQRKGEGKSEGKGEGQGGGGGAPGKVGATRESEAAGTPPAGPVRPDEDLRKSVGSPASRPTGQAEAKDGSKGGNPVPVKPNATAEADRLRKAPEGEKSAGGRPVEKSAVERSQEKRMPGMPAAKAANGLESEPAASPAPTAAMQTAPGAFVPAAPSPPTPTPRLPKPTVTGAPQPGVAGVAAPQPVPTRAMPFEGGYATRPEPEGADAQRDFRAEDKANGTSRRALQEQAKPEEAPGAGKPQAAAAPMFGAVGKEAAKQSPMGATAGGGLPTAASPPQTARRNDDRPAADGMLRQRAIDSLALYDFESEPATLLILSVEMSQPAVQAAALDQVLARNRVAWRTADPATVGVDLAVALGSEGEPLPAAPPASKSKSTAGVETSPTSKSTAGVETSPTSTAGVETSPTSKSTAGVEAIWLEAPREVVDLILEEMAGRPEAFPQVELRSRREAAPAATAVAANAPQGSPETRLKRFADQVRGLAANSSKGAEVPREGVAPAEPAGAGAAGAFAAVPAEAEAAGVPQFAQRVRLPEAVEARLLAGTDRLQRGASDRQALAGTLAKKDDRTAKAEAGPVRLLLLVRSAKAPTILR